MFSATSLSSLFTFIPNSWIRNKTWSMTTGYTRISVSFTKALNFWIAKHNDDIVPSVTNVQNNLIGSDNESTLVPEGDISSFWMLQYIFRRIFGWILINWNWIENDLLHIFSTKSQIHLNKISKWLQNWIECYLTFKAASLVAI